MHALLTGLMQRAAIGDDRCVVLERTHRTIVAHHADAPVSLSSTGARWRPGSAIGNARARVSSHRSPICAVHDAPAAEGVDLGVERRAGVPDLDRAGGAFRNLRDKPCARIDCTLHPMPAVLRCPSR